MMSLDASSGSSKKDVRKIGLLCVLFVVLVGTFLVSLNRSKPARQPSELPVERYGAPEGVEEALPVSKNNVAAGETNEGGSEGAEIPIPSEKIQDRRMTIEKGYLFELLTAARGMSEKEMKSRAVETPFKDFFDNPADWRGKVLHLEGRIKRITPRRPEQLPPEMDTLYEAQVIDHDGYWYYLFIVDNPRCGTEDLVTFDGIFMKVHGYENRKGTMTLAPLFVVKNFNELKLESPSVFRAVGWGVLGVVVLVAVILVAVVRGQSRTSEGIARAAEEKRLGRARQWAQSRERKSEPQEQRSEGGSADDES